MLNTLLSYVVPETVKRSSICQCIIKASRPRTALPPLLLGLGIECDHVFGSKWLVNELFKLGFPISYSEVNRFKKSVVANQPMGNSVINSYPKVFTQFAGDNVDHNIKTLDGSGTFHGMGVIAISTPFPGNSVLKECDKISREKDITSEVSANNKGIAIHNYVHPVKSALSSMEVKPLIKLQSPVILPSNDIDNLWQASWYFRNSSNYRPNWSGYM